MQRHYDLPGLINFRELGGYPVTDLDGNARHTRSGCLFRAGHFHDVDNSAQQALHALGIDLVLDLRNAKERAKRPNCFAETHAPQTLPLELDPGSGASWQSLFKRNDGAEKLTLDSAQVETLMSTLNTSLVTDHAAVYRQMFDTLLAHEPRAAVIHCASGKDRTGIAAALLLAALGASRDTIVADYLLSNQYLDAQHHIARAMADFGNLLSISDTTALQALYEVRAAYIDAALDAIDKKYGGMGAYLEQAMGLDHQHIARLQARYLI